MAKNYTAADIKELRERTGAGMLDVKKALDESDGDKSKAQELLRIKGLKGEFVVMDKMSSRWNNRIDLYMGHDLRAAKLWGKRRVKMIWKEQ